MANKVYGIDLGTTYSVIATLDNNSMPVIIKNEDDNDDRLASAVYFESDSNIVVGEVAKEMAVDIIQKDNVVQFIKREIEEMGNPSHNAWEREFYGKKYNPITISALILKRIKDYSAEKDEDVKDVVITCPAEFGIESRNAIRQAGEIAGLNVLEVLNEPTAAAINYCSREFGERKKILVYDLGGGTFDVTIMDLDVNSDGKVTVKTVDSRGNHRLGGVDWDNRLYEYVCELIEQATNSDIDEDLKCVVSSQIEGIKQKLSKVEQHSFTFTGGRVTVLKSEFEARTEDLVDKTINFVKSLLADNSLTVNDIDQVLLVGGSTCMPMIKEAVGSLFTSDKVRVEDPHLAVAKGAAIKAAIEVVERVLNDKDDASDIGEKPKMTDEEARELSKHIPGNFAVESINDIISRSFGVTTWVVDKTGESYKISNHIFIGSPSPSTDVGYFQTREDYQTSVSFEIYESTAKEKYITPLYDEKGNEQTVDPALKIKKLGDLVLPIPEGKLKGYRVTVYFTCSVSGLDITAEDPETGKKVKKEIDFIGHMGRAEVKLAKEFTANADISGDING